MRHLPVSIDRALRTKARGAVTLELLITLPLLVIGCMAAVEMGLWMSGRERLEMATRTGVEAAAASLDLEEVHRRVCDYLGRGNVATENVELLLVHNLRGNVEQSYPSKADWSNITLPQPPASKSRYVRLVVRVPSSDLAPNLLKSFGFDLREHTSVHVKTLRYEGI